jgi:hypothetical protein
MGPRDLVPIIWDVELFYLLSEALLTPKSRLSKVVYHQKYANYNQGI